MPFIRWNNAVETERPQITILRMRISRSKTKAKNTHLDYVIFIAFLLQRWLKERVSVLRDVYIACLASEKFNCGLS